MTGWLVEDRRTLATDRILDAAAALFAEHGVTGVGMGDIARVAGCSRATLYRYFPDRAALHLAFVQREALAVGRLVAAEVRGVPPHERVARAVLAAVRMVRGNPALAAWFTGADHGSAGGLAAGLASSSEVVAVLGLSMTTDPDDARWLVRVVVSLLTMPGRDADDERRMVERYLVPVLGPGRPVEPR